MKLIDMTVTNFAKEVDSVSPAPGGGSVAALASDIGVGLARMMAHLSFGKKKYEALDEDIKKEFQSRFEKKRKIREELSKLVDEDTQSFNEFMNAVKMPKDTFKQITERQKALSVATLNSIKVPYKTAYLSLEAMRELEFMVDNGNQNAINAILIDNKSLVAQIARRYFLLGGDQEDLIQEGMIGLFKAINIFDKTKKYILHEHTLK